MRQPQPHGLVSFCLLYPHHHLSHNFISVCHQTSFNHRHTDFCPSATSAMTSLHCVTTHTHINHKPHGLASFCLLYPHTTSAMTSLPSVTTHASITSHTDLCPSATPHHLSQDFSSVCHHAHTHQPQATRTAHVQLATTTTTSTTSTTWTIRWAWRTSASCTPRRGG